MDGNLSSASALVTIYSPETGRLGPIISAQNEAELAPHLEGGAGFVTGAWRNDRFEVDLTTGDVVPRVKLLAERQNELWEQVKRKRTKVEFGGCETQFGRVQTDERSRTNLSGAALAATLAQLAQQSFDIAWTLENNDVVMLTAGEMQTLGLTVALFVRDCHDRARSLRDEIFEAANADELADVDINTGWPA